MEIKLTKKTGVPKAEVEAHQQIQREFTNTPFSKGWRVPDYPLWGRGEAFSQTVSGLASELQAHGVGDDLYVCAHADQAEEQDVTNLFRVRALRELHFSRPIQPVGRLMGGRLELMLYPTAFMAGLIHMPIPGNTGLWVPIGFLSALPKHVDAAHKLLRQAMAATRYGRRARFSPKDSRPQPISFEDAFPFLNYDSPVRSGGDDEQLGEDD